MLIGFTCTGDDTSDDEGGWQRTITTTIRFSIQFGERYV